MNKRVTAFILTLVMLISLLPCNLRAEAATGAAVVSHPTVQSMTKTTGQFVLTANARFFLVSSENPADSELAEYVRLINAEFAAKRIPTAETLPIVYGDISAVMPGDIVVAVDPAVAPKAQGYRMVIEDSSVTITGCDALGAYYGLVTLLQTMVSGGTTLQGAVVEDWPDVRERSLYIDCGRVFYSPALLKAIIRTLSWNKMNVLYLDFSNNNATRFFLDNMQIDVSGTTYNIAKAKPSNGYLTQSDMDEILAEAARYGVEIIPTFNSPGHIGGLYSLKPAFFDKASASDYDSSCGKVTLLIENADAYAFGIKTTMLYANYFAAKGCKYFNIAADEATLGNVSYNSKNKYFVNYVNELNTEIKKLGMTTRLFNDGVKAATDGIDKDMDILYWAPDGTAASLMSAGYNIVNFSYGAGLYYAYLGSINGWWVWNQDAGQLYSSWRPGVLNRNTSNSYSYIATETADITNSHFLGANFAIWSDYAFTSGLTGDAMFAKNSYNMMQKILLVGERSWSSAGTKSYSNWQSSITTAPGGVTLSASKDTTSLPQASEITAAAGDSPYEAVIGDFTVSATRTGMEKAEILWTIPASDGYPVVFTLTKTVAGNTITLLSESASTSYTDADARQDAVYTVRADALVNGIAVAAPVSVSATTVGGGLPVFETTQIRLVSAGGEARYELDTDGIEDGTYVLVIYNTHNESSGNYYAVSTSMKSSASPYGLITTRATSLISSNNIDISSLSSRNYLWNVTKNGSTYTIAAADGSGVMSIDGSSNVNLTGSRTALTFSAGSRSNAYFVNYSGSNGYRLDMYSDREGYRPTNGQCLLSAWDTSGRQNHNNVYFYRQVSVGGSATYVADTTALRELIAFANGIDRSAYTNWNSLGLDALLARAEEASAVTQGCDEITAQAEQTAVNEAGQALYDAILQLGQEPVYYGSVTIVYVDDAGETLRASVTMTGEAGSDYTIIPEVMDNYDTPAMVSGTYGRDTTETVTLVYVLNTDKSALAAQLGSVVAQGDYTDESYAIYTEALSAGRVVYDNARAKQAEVDAAVEAIAAAREGLKSAITVIEPQSMTGSSNISFYGSYSASKALDGSTGTYAWLESSQKSGDWFCVTFDDVYTISSVSVVSHYGKDYIRSANIQVSVDGNSWTTIGSIAGSASYAPMTVTVDGYVDAKYVRILLTSSANYWWIVNEMSFTFGPASQYVPEEPEMPLYRLNNTEIVSGAEYVIKAGSANYALAVSGTSLTRVAVSPDGNAISNVDDRAIWIVRTQGNGVTLQNKATGYYLYIVTSSWGSSARLSLSTSAVTTYFMTDGNYGYFYRTAGYRYTYLGYSNGFSVTTSNSSSARRMMLYVLE